MIDATNTGRLARLLAWIGIAIGSVVALVGLMGWEVGSNQWAALRNGVVGMAPAAALLILCLSAALALGRFQAKHKSLRTVGLVFALISSLGATEVLLRNFIGVGLDWEKWIQPLAVHQGNQPRPISPFTGLVLLLGGLVAVSRAAGLTSRRPVRAVGDLAAAFNAVLSGLFILQYASTAPLFYGGRLIPMALPTAIALFSLSQTLLAERVAGWIGRADGAPDSDAVPPLERDKWRRLLKIVSVSAFAIIIFGTGYLWMQQSELRDAAYRELATIADAKVEQIRQWRNERLHDVAFLQTAPAVAESVRELQARPGDQRAREAVLGWLRPIREGHKYVSALLLDLDGKPLVSLPDAAEPNERIQEAVRRSLASKSAVLDDLYPSENGYGALMNMVAPIVGSTDVEHAQPVGVIAVQVDVTGQLFPLIQAWPVPSKSAECLLVRREGDQVIYLNDLRHRKGTAFRLRRSAADPDLPAAMAVRGETRIISSWDYRENARARRGAPRGGHAVGFCRKSRPGRGVCAHAAPGAHRRARGSRVAGRSGCSDRDDVAQKRG
ncbi:MAG: hypothetical protein QM790_15525 [Nibricoccus sp.]